MQSAVVTTPLQGETQFADRARDLARRLRLPFVKRRKRSLQAIMAEHAVDAVWVVGHRIEIHTRTERPYFFHPGMSVTRIKRLEKGERDPLIDIGHVKPGDAVLDCTLGMASDALVLAYAVGETGKVYGIESHPWIACLVEEGLKQGYPELPALAAAMQRIRVQLGDHLQVLSQLPDKSYDLVYFDPMFRKTISTSTGIRILQELAAPQPLSEQAVAEAVRVARKRVVMKERYQSREFERLGFRKVEGGATRIAYGYIEC
jgi:16S rRNA (guanine1516-N2)-methyltransferase